MAKPGVYWNESWNPVTGCTPCSPACENCWARATAERFPRAHGGWRVALGQSELVPFSEIIPHPDRLDAPLHWKKPRVVAVSWMGDWMHDEVPTRFLDQMLDVMGATPQHTYLTLTKRPENLDEKLYGVTEEHGCRELGGGDYLPNLWIGGTIWDQPSADRVLPIILAVPAAHRWVSVEPCLSPVDLSDWLGPDPTFDHESGLHQVVAGCESGPYRRSASNGWFRSLRDQCSDAGMPFYLKQLCENEDGTGKVVKEPYLDGKQHLELAWEVKRRWVR